MRNLDLFRHVRSNEIDNVSWTIKQGADPRWKNSEYQGYTAVHQAATLGHLETVQFLLEHGGDANIQSDKGETPLHSAASYDQWETVQWLVQHGGADVDIKNNKGQTASDALRATKSKSAQPTIAFLGDFKAGMEAKKAAAEAQKAEREALEREKLELAKQNAQLKEKSEQQQKLFLYTSIGVTVLAVGAMVYRKYAGKK